MSTAEISSFEIASILGEIPRPFVLQTRDNPQIGWFAKLNSRIDERFWIQVVNVAVAMALFLVAIASIYDAYLVYKYRFCITEENPICRWLISFDPDSVMVFMCTKLLSTSLVVAIVAVIYKYWRPAGILTTVSLFAFQIGLMGYLHFFDSYV